jgi:hypothetical protein
MNLAEFGLPTMNIFAEDERLFCFGSRTWSGARLRSGIQALQPDEGAVQGDRQRQAAHFQGAEAAAPPAKGGKGGPGGRQPIRRRAKGGGHPPHEHRYFSCFFKPGNMMIE